MMNNPNMESPADAKQQMWAGTEIGTYVEDILNEDFPTTKMYRLFVMRLYKPGNDQDNWLDWMVELDDRGIEPWEEQGFVPKFRKMGVVAFSAMKNDNPNMTTAAMSLPARDSKRIPRTLLTDELFIIGCLPGGTGLIYGSPGAGKSNIAIGEIYRTAINQHNWEVDVNIPIQDMAYNSKFNGTLSGTLLHGAKFAREMTINGNKDFMIVWINDEAQFARDRQRSSAAENMAMKQINLVARMFGFFQWSIMQQNKPPSEVADFCTHFIEKPSRTHPGTANLRVRGKYHYDVKMSNVPAAEERGIIYEDMTKLTYKVDINPLRMFDYISGLADKSGLINTVAQYDAVIDYIEKHRGEKLDIISDDLVATILYRARKRLINKMPKEVGYRRLGLLVGWDEKKCERRVKKAEQDEIDGLIVPDDTDDMIQDLSGAIDVGHD